MSQSDPVADKEDMGHEMDLGVRQRHRSQLINQN